MEDHDPTPEEVLRHFGYPEDTQEKGVGIGCWEKSKTFDNLADLPGLIPYLDKNKKIRIVFDYDPDFPRALLQVTGLKDSDYAVHHSDGRTTAP